MQIAFYVPHLQAAEPFLNVQVWRLTVQIFLKCGKLSAETCSKLDISILEFVHKRHRLPLAGL